MNIINDILELKNIIFITEEDAHPGIYEHITWKPIIKINKDTTTKKNVADAILAYLDDKHFN